MSNFEWATIIMSEISLPKIHCPPFRRGRQILSKKNVQSLSHVCTMPCDIFKIKSANAVQQNVVRGQFSIPPFAFFHYGILRKEKNLRRVCVNESKRRSDRKRMLLLSNHEIKEENAKTIVTVAEPSDILMMASSNDSFFYHSFTTLEAIIILFNFN